MNTTPLGLGRSNGEPMPTKTILVCDDEPAMRELLRIVLAADYDVDEAADGVEVLERIREREPDLLVLDVMLPGRSGLEVLAELRRDPAHAETPVIVITAWDHVEEGARAAGADLFLLKPFGPDELRGAVAQLLDGS